MILLKQLAQTYREVVSEFFFNLARIFLPPRTPMALTEKLWQNSSYLQRGGLNNCFTQ